MTAGGGRAPSLSVVIAATDSPAASALAREAVEGQADGRVEVLVVAGASVPRLRRLGLEAAKGRVVVFTEDSCLSRPGWVDAWLEAFGDPELVAGSGSVELFEGASKLDQAVVFCEYAPFLPEAPESPVARLAGNNFALLREVARLDPGEEVHEVALLGSIRGRGGLVRMVEGARVRHVRRFGWREAFGDRFRFGLEFGRLRTVGASPWVRWAGLVAGPAILAAQVLRLTRTVLANPSERGRFVEALPITLALLAAWSLGEWIGWSLGPPHACCGFSRRVDRASGEPHQQSVVGLARGSDPPYEGSPSRSQTT